MSHVHRGKSCTIQSNKVSPRAPYTIVVIDSVVVFNMFSDDGVGGAVPSAWPSLSRQARETQGPVTYAPALLGPKSTQPQQAREQEQLLIG